MKFSLSIFYGIFPDIYYIKSSSNKLSILNFRVLHMQQLIPNIFIFLVKSYTQHIVVIRSYNNGIIM